MITVPLFVFLLIYFGLVALFAIMILVHIYHIFTTASLTLASFIVMLIILFGAGFTLYFTFAGLVGVDWSAPVTLWNSNRFSF